MSCNGMLAGLVAITAPCAFVAPWAATVIGIIAGVLVCWSVEFFDKKARVDDPCGAISVHGVCGAWGVLAVGLFADGTYGIGWNGVSASACTACRGMLLRRRRAARRPDHRHRRRLHLGVGRHVAHLPDRHALHARSRVDPEVEIEGLDEGEFGQVCYPDFVIRTETDIGVTHELGRAGRHVGGDTRDIRLAGRERPVEITGRSPSGALPIESFADRRARRLR